jgi:hypothetical protein
LKKAREVIAAAERWANFDTFQPIPLEEIKSQYKASMMDLVSALKDHANESL